MRELYTLSVSDSEWMEDAECARTDPGLFLSGSEEVVLAICARCPVREECLTYAVENDERFGIWGGMTAAERRCSHVAPNKRRNDPSESSRRRSGG